MKEYECYFLFFPEKLNDRRKWCGNKLREYLKIGGKIKEENIMKIIQTKINRITIMEISTREEIHKFVDESRAKGFHVQAFEKKEDGYYLNMFKESPMEEISEKELREM